MRDLTKRSDLGQMIRVRAANGQVLVSLGPSFGQWLPYDQIPPEMRAAMISTEDRRFRSHIGVDPIGIGRAIGSALVKNRRVSATSTITQQLARNIFLTNNRSFGAQDQGSDPGARARAQILERTRSSSSTSTASISAAAPMASTRRRASSSATAPTI